MKILFWSLEILALVAMATKTVGGQACNHNDVRNMIVVHTGTTQATVSLSVVRKFVEIQKTADINIRNRHGDNPFDANVAADQETGMMKELLRADGQPDNFRGTEISGHHIIPWTVIGQELTNMANSNRIFSNQMYGKVKQGLERLIGGIHGTKAKTWRAAIQSLIQDVGNQCDGGNIDLPQAIENIAYGLNYMIRWTPNNIVYGPNRRSDDPGNGVDTPILNTFANRQKAKFKVWGRELSANFRYQETGRWYTIVDLMAEIDSGPGIQGPVWMKHGHDNHGNEQWKVNSQSNKKICSSDYRFIPATEKCSGRDPRAFVVVTDGSRRCFGSGNQDANTKGFSTLCSPAPNSG